MRHLLLLFAILLVAGCFQLGSSPSGDACPGHGNTDPWSPRSNCACPLASAINAALDGQACTHPNLTCYSSGGLFARSCTCDWWTGRWRCDEVVDFSVPDLATPTDLARESMTD